MDTIYLNVTPNQVLSILKVMQDFPYPKACNHAIVEHTVSGAVDPPKVHSCLKDSISDLAKAYVVKMTWVGLEVHLHVTLHTTDKLKLWENLVKLKYRPVLFNNLITVGIRPLFTITLSILVITAHLHTGKLCGVSPDLKELLLLA